MGLPATNTGSKLTLLRHASCSGRWREQPQGHGRGEAAAEGQPCLPVCTQEAPPCASRSASSEAEEGDNALIHSFIHSEGLCTAGEAGAAIQCTSHPLQSPWSASLSPAACWTLPEAPGPSGSAASALPHRPRDTLRGGCGELAWSPPTSPRAWEAVSVHGSLSLQELPGLSVPRGRGAGLRGQDWTKALGLSGFRRTELPGGSQDGSRGTAGTAPPVACLHSSELFQLPAPCGLQSPGGHPGLDEQGAPSRYLPRPPGTATKPRPLGTQTPRPSSRLTDAGL